MRFIKRSIASLLFICMLFTVMPAEVMTAAFADGGNMVGSSVQNDGPRGTKNWAGGTGQTDSVEFRVVLSRNKNTYLNGTQEQRDKVVSYYKSRWPSDSDLESNTIFLLSYTSANWFNTWNKTKAGQRRWVGAYHPGQQGLSFYAGYYRSLLLDLVDVGSAGNNAATTYREYLKTANSFKNKVMAEYGTSITSMSDLAKDNRWLNYMPSAEEARKVISYIFEQNSGGSYNVDERITAFIEGNDAVGCWTKDPSELNADQKMRISAGYAGLLTCFYSFIASTYNYEFNQQHMTETGDAVGVREKVAGTYFEAINDYLLNANSEEKPVSLIIDTASSFIYQEDKNFILPDIDYLQFVGLVEQNEALTNPDNQILANNSASKGNTRQLLTTMYNMALTRKSWKDYYAGRGPSANVRYLDYYLGRMGELAYAPMQYSYTAQFFNKQMLRTVDGGAYNGQHTGTRQVRFSGKIEHLLFDGTQGSGTSGFMIIGHHIVNPVPEVSYHVDSTVDVLTRDCNVETTIENPSTITLSIKGDSSLISALNSRKENPNFEGVKIDTEIYRTVYKNGWEEGNIVDARKQMPELENQVDGILNGDDMIAKLQNEPFILKDTTMIGDKLTRDTASDSSYRYKYEINVDVTIDRQTYEFNYEDIVLKGRGGADRDYYDFAEINLPIFTNMLGKPEDIVIVKPSSIDTTEIVDPSKDENLRDNTQMVKRMGFSTEGEEFAEIKSNAPLNEEYEVMGGIPSSEEIYFSVGGSEFKLALVMQYWMNEHSRDRTYTVHFDGNTCEFNNNELNKGDTWPGADQNGANGMTKIPVPTVTPTISDYTLSHDGDYNISATWKGTMPWIGKAQAKEAHGGTHIEINEWDWTEFNKAITSANAWMEALNATKITWDAASEKTGGVNSLREYTLEADITSTDGTSEHQKADKPHDGVNCSVSDGWCGGHGEEGSGDHSGSTTDGKGGTFEITVKIKDIKPHMICGPCCGHVMPELWDTWRQGLVYDFAKISQVRLFKLDQGSVDGLQELTGVDTVFANVISGNPTYFMNIAQMTEKQTKNTTVLPDGYDSTVNDSKKGLNEFDGHILTYFSGQNRKLAQSSRAGRLRYTLADGQTTETITITEQGNGTGGTYTFDPNLIAAPTQHDDVIYNAGARSKNCDGMATTNNFDKLSSNNVRAMETTGHVNPWADGCLYTNILNRTVHQLPDGFGMTKNTAAYSGYWDYHLYSATTDTQNFEANTLQTYSSNDEHITKYKEDYNHHVVREDVLSGVSTELKKTAYNDAADEIDTQTAEWKFFDKARRTKVIATVISDFLILQTSGGDQSVFYYEKESEPTEAQEHFQKVKIDENELFLDNPLSLFTGDMNCVSTDIKSTHTGNFIMVGGYNGQYNKPSEKYKPFNPQDGQFKNFGGENGTAWTQFCATDYNENTKGSYGGYSVLGNHAIKTILDDDPAKTITRPKRQVKDQASSFKIVQTGIQILPTAPNKLYTPENAKVFYSEVLGYYSIDKEAFDRESGTYDIVSTLGNVSIGWPQQVLHGDYYQEYWGNKNGVDYSTLYFKTPIGDSSTGTVNSLVVFTPVSTEEAMVMNQPDLDINGMKVSRDQRTNAFEYPNMNDLVNKLKVCPLDPELCEFRFLDCKFHKDTVLLDIDFEDTYMEKEIRRVKQEDGSVKETVKEIGLREDATRYDETLKRWITTNKVNGVEYILPEGFTIGQNGSVGSGGYLRANGTRWSLPFSEFGLSNANTNRITVKMDITVNSWENNLMPVSFHNLGFLLNNGSDKTGSFITKSPLDNSQIGARMDVGTSKLPNNITLEMTFSFNNVVDCNAVVNGVYVPLTVSDLKDVWQPDANGIRRLNRTQKSITPTSFTRNEINKVETPQNWIDEQPSCYTKKDIGSNLNIGGWSQDDAYKANFSIDNLQVILKGGTNTHSSICYERLTVHATNKIHVHDEDCYLKEPLFTCDGALNDKYVCNGINNRHEHTTACYTNVSGTSVDVPQNSSLEKEYVAKKAGTITLDGYGSCSAETWTGKLWVNGVLKYDFYDDVAGYYSYTYKKDDVIKFYVYSENSCGVGWTVSYTSGSFGELTGNCTGTLNAHTHTGEANKPYPNGCYTIPTVHTHNLKYNRSELTCKIPEGDGGGTVYNFAYTGNMQNVTLPAGVYRLEVWGARGNSTASGGGYSVGDYAMQTSDTLYIGVGGAAATFNGGGTGYHGNAGGATHIGLKNSVLSGYSTDYESQLLIVAGGAGGSNSGTGGYGGGANSPGGKGGSGCGQPGGGGTLTGGGTNSYSNVATSYNGTMNYNGSFGQGGIGTRNSCGGGGGFYGGAASYEDYRKNDSDDAGGGGGSGYANTAKLTNISGTDNTCTTNGSARITRINHTHTAACYSNTNHEETCVTLPVGTLVCTGELNTETDFNVHIHTAECLTTTASFDAKWFRYTDGVQTFVVPYTDYYTIEAYGPSTTTSGRTGYSKVRAYLKANTVLYIYVGGIAGYNNYTTDVRTYPLPNSSDNVDGNSVADLTAISDKTKLLYANRTEGGKGENSACAVQLLQTGVRGNSENGRVIITCENTAMEDIYNKIITGQMTHEEAKKYLGETVYNKIMEGKEGLLHTWEDWTYNNTKGFTEVQNAKLLYGGASLICGKTEADPGSPIEIPYSGVVEEMTLTAGEYLLEVWGAQGGSYDTTNVGGKGGYSVGTINIKSSTKVYVNVGGEGKIGDSTTGGLVVSGGFNGGGAAKNPGIYAYSGGGGTDIRIGQDSLYARVIVAGGGGGGSTNGIGGYGGGTSGESITTHGSEHAVGSGGSQTTAGNITSQSGSSWSVSAGSFGQGGYGYENRNNSSGWCGTGGGGGWYGGSGGDAGQGAGGSGYVYTESTATYTNSGYTGGTWLLNSDYYLTSAETIAGNQKFTSPEGTEETGHSGNGYARITPLSHTHTDECYGGVAGGGGTATTLTCGIPVGGDGQVRTYGTGGNTYNPTNGYGSTSTTLPAGRYRLEVWGAQGGGDTYGGKGGYSVGEYTLNSSDILYINVGGKGEKVSVNGSSVEGGYNGGGAATTDYSGTEFASSGGGATHVALKTGLLTAFSGDYNTQLLLVAGGGGGGTYCSTNNNNTPYATGGAGGGTSGLKGSTTNSGGGGTQTAGGTKFSGNATPTDAGFGFGGSTKGLSSGNGSGGGGGFYGGGAAWYKGNSYISCAGGGGSGYVNLNLLDSGTTYVGNTSFSNTAGTGNETGHSGNGFVKITSLDHQHTADCYTTVQIPDGYILNCDITKDHVHSMAAGCFIEFIGEDGLTVISSGNPAQFEVPLGNINVEAISKIVVYSKNCPNTFGKIYLKDDTGTYNENDSVTSNTITPNTENQVMTFILQDNPNFSGEFTSLMFELANVTGRFNISKIEVYGYGEKVAGTGDGSGNVGGTPMNFEYKGYTQAVNLSQGTYKLEVWGAQGGNMGSYYGGKGGYSVGNLKLNTSTTLYVTVGGRGNNTQSGGFNGGGTVTGSDTSTYQASGGGATDISLYGTANTTSWNTTNHLYSRIIVAGGGGGATSYSASDGGHGGGIEGLVSPGNTSNNRRGLGGTQTSGGSWTTLGSSSYTVTAGTFGSGGSGYNTGSSGWPGSGGGSGWYGGGGGTAAGGAGGSGYVYTSSTAGNYPSSCKLNNNYYLTDAQTIAGDTSFLSPTGTSEIGHSGNGYARITPLNTFTPLEIIYEDPFDGSEDIILEEVDGEYTNLNLIPDKIDGDYNPIWKCKFKEPNAHACVTTNDNGLEIVHCKTHVIFNCSEVHHRGEHYNVSNRICWSACGDDANHANTKTETKDKEGNDVKLAEFLQLDAAFTVYFPNVGDFEGNDALGLSKPQVDRGYGYDDNMDTTDWTREKRVKFPFDVIYHNKKTNKYEIYKGNAWIELDVPTVYFNFYILASNAEMQNVPVEFEVEAINGGTNSGVKPKRNIEYDSNIIDKKYEDALKNFRDNYVSKLKDSISGGYKIPYPNVTGTNSSSGVERAFNDSGYWSFYSTKQSSTGLDGVLRAAIDTINKQIENDFEGNTSSDSYIDPHENQGKTGVNNKLKKVTGNDNKIMLSNRRRSNSLESLHGGYKEFYLDVIGRIGNFALVDTEDYRFSEFFKVPVVSNTDLGALADEDNWLIEGAVLNVNPALQNYYVGDSFDIRGNEASLEAVDSLGTHYLNTYNTQSWMQGLIGADGKRDMSKPNLVSQILTSDLIHNRILKGEELRFGYDAYTSIVTLGSYTGARVQVVPKYFAMKLNDNPSEILDTKGQVVNANDFIPLDVYISKEGTYLPINIYGNAANGNPNINEYTLNGYSMNLDWTTEGDRRNYGIDEQGITNDVKAHLSRLDYGLRDEEGGGSFDGDTDTPTNIPDEIKLVIPEGKNNYLGTAQYMLMSDRHRTFIGSSVSYGGNTYKSRAGTSEWGDDKDPDNIIPDNLFKMAVQRWHGKLGVPSSAVFVPHAYTATGTPIADRNTSTLTPVNSETTSWVMNDDWAIICTAEIIAVGDVWSIYYSQPWFKTMTVSGQMYNTVTVGGEHYPGHRVYNDKGQSEECPHCLPPIIAIYSSDSSSVDDVEIVQTH